MDESGFAQKFLAFRSLDNKLQIDRVDIEYVELPNQDKPPFVIKIAEGYEISAKDTSEVNPPLELPVDKENDVIVTVVYRPDME